MRTVKQKEFTLRILFISILLLLLSVCFCILFSGCHKQEKDLLKNQDWNSNSPATLTFSLNEHHKGSWQHVSIEWRITAKNHLQIKWPHSEDQYYEMQKLTSDSLVLFHSLDNQIIRLHH